MTSTQITTRPATAVINTFPPAYTYYPVLCIALFLCGCNTLESWDFDNFAKRASRSRKQSGDFAAFLTGQLAECGMPRRTAGTLPALNGKWYSESDGAGFTALLYDVPFNQIQPLMEQAYGPPTGCTTDRHGEVLCWYDSPAPMKFFGLTKGVGFICSRKWATRSSN